MNQWDVRITVCYRTKSIMTNKREELEEKKLLILKEFRTNLSATTVIYNFCFKIIEQVSLRK